MANRLTGRFSKESNKTFTENGAETYQSTGNPVLDFFYLAPARQGMDNLGLFNLAYDADAALSLKAAFYLRDVRNGKGQRNTFRDIMAWLYMFDMPTFEALVPYVPQLGRWDDILMYPENPAVARLVFEQIKIDMNSERVSLLGKWMPSENTSSKATRELARRWMKTLGLRPSGYRHVLSTLRSRIDVVERKMSSNTWEDIVYPYVPSRAMKLYRKAFGRHDPVRFKEYIDDALEGNSVIHSGTVYPHELVYQATKIGVDKAIDAMWSQLPNYFDTAERRVLPIVDVSGSMTVNLRNSNVRAIDVSIGLGLYCAERNVGPFQNYFMTFSDWPQMVKVTGNSLSAKINSISNAHSNMNTNLQAAFTALLRMALEEGATSDEMPTNLLIISDMEFDACASGTNLNGIRRRYEAAGYEMPIVTFWNVMGRNKQTPALEDDSNVYLVSGFSAETIGKILNSKAINPEELMLEVLNSGAYDFVDTALKNIRRY